MGMEMSGVPADVGALVELRARDETERNEGECAGGDGQVGVASDEDDEGIASRDSSPVKPIVLDMTGDECFRMVIGTPFDNFHFDSI